MAWASAPSQARGICYGGKDRDAAGSGALSIPAARRGAEVVATDIAPTMIERLSARARAEGLANIEGRVMDGQRLILAGDTFDVSASQHGVTMFADLGADLAEMVRVTKPGGTVLVVAFGAPQKAEFLGLFVGAIKAVGPGFTGPPMAPPPLPFQLADPGVFRSKLTAAGLADAAVETITWDMPVGSAARLWNEVTSSNPIGAQLVATLTEAQRGDVLRVLDGILRERSGGQPGAVLQAEVNVGAGTKLQAVGERPAAAAALRAAARHAGWGSQPSRAEPLAPPPVPPVQDPQSASGRPAPLDSADAVSVASMTVILPGGFGVPGPRCAAPGRDRHDVHARGGAYGCQRPCGADHRGGTQGRRVPLHDRVPDPVRDLLPPLDGRRVTLPRSGGSVG